MDIINDYKQLRMIENLSRVKKLTEENAKLKELLETRCYNEVEFENKKLKEELAEANQLKDMYHTYYRAKHDDIKGIIFKQKEKLEKIKSLINKLDLSLGCTYGDYDCDNCSDLSEDIVCSIKLQKVILDIIEGAEND